MDNISPKMAATFGVGFLGFILAAYSYNKYHKPEYTEELILNTENEENSNNNDDTNDNKTIEEFIVKHNIDNYIEVSAKQNLNIEQLFRNIVSKIHNKRKTNKNTINEEPILPPSLIDFVKKNNLYESTN